MFESIKEVLGLTPKINYDEKRKIFLEEIGATEYENLCKENMVPIHKKTHTSSKYPVMNVGEGTHSYYLWNSGYMYNMAPAFNTYSKDKEFNILRVPYRIIGDARIFGHNCVTINDYEDFYIFEDKVFLTFMGLWNDTDGIKMRFPDRRIINKTTHGIYFIHSDGNYYTFTLWCGANSDLQYPQIPSLDHPILQDYFIKEGEDGYDSMPWIPGRDMRTTR